MRKIYKYELVGFFTILILFFIHYLTNNNLLDIDNLKILIGNYGIYSIIIFFFIFTLISLIGFPINISITVAAILFGIVKGFMISLLMVTTSGIIAFKFSRYFKNRFIKNHPYTQDKNIITKIKNNIEKHIHTNQLKIVVILRLMFMPYIETSYACGLIEKLKFKFFILGTFIINILYCVIYIYLGNSITKNLKYFTIAVIIFVIFLSVPRIIKYIRLHKITTENWKLFH